MKSPARVFGVLLAATLGTAAMLLVLVLLAPDAAEPWSFGTVGLYVLVAAVLAYAVKAGRPFALGAFAFLAAIAVSADMVIVGLVGGGAGRVAITGIAAIGALGPALMDWDRLFRALGRKQDLPE